MATTHESDGATPDAGFTSLSDYMAARDGEMSWDDVRVAPDAPAAAVPPAAADGGGSAGGGSPTEPPAAAAATPQTDTPPVAPSAPEPSAQQVSEAARTLSQHGRQKTRAQQRQDEIQARIDELTAKRHEVNSGYEAEQKRLNDLKAERERLEREIEERRRQPSPSTAPAAPAVQPPRAAVAPVQPGANRPEPPRVEDIGTDAIPTWDDYARLNAAWQIQFADWTTREAARRAEDVARRTVDHERVVSTWESRQAAAREKHPDFDAVAFSDDIVVSEVLAQKIVRDPQGPDIAYYLGKNPSEARRIASLAPDDQLVEFGSLRVKATAVAAAPAGPVAPQVPPAPTAPAIPKSQAPAPVSPVGSAPTASRVPLESRSLSDYIDETNAEEDRRRRR